MLSVPKETKSFFLNCNLRPRLRSRSTMKCLNTIPAHILKPARMR